MSVISKYKILSQAKDSFSKAEFDVALEKFATVLQNYPNSKEAYNGVILSEMAMSGEGGAEALFDYYEILKEENSEEADMIMSDLLSNMDGTLDTLGQMFADPILERIEAEDGILYSDFKEIIKNGSSFKETFENIMFSTRVIITAKEDFIEFLDSLIEHGFNKMALAYLEGALAAYPSDEKIRKLLTKLSKGTMIEN
jgi:tetratricopeptide (TPR) repeat protein